MSVDVFIKLNAPLSIFMRGGYRSSTTILSIISLIFIINISPSFPEFNSVTLAAYKWCAAFL